jgi:hypothetical protein
VPIRRRSHLLLPGCSVLHSFGGEVLGTVSVTAILRTSSIGGSENSIHPTLILEESALKDETTAGSFRRVSRPELIELLNQDMNSSSRA